jgi:hypothetical protein
MQFCMCVFYVKGPIRSQLVGEGSVRGSTRRKMGSYFFIDILL